MQWKTSGYLYFLDLYYGGEAVSADQPQAFSCPYCGKMGYTDMTLQDHITADHSESPAEVVSKPYSLANSILKYIYFVIIWIKIYYHTSIYLNKKW